MVSKMKNPKKMNMKIKFSILGIVALIAVSGCLQSQIHLDPPMATLTIVKSNYGINSSQGFGSYCLKEIWIGPCKDKMGILTLQEPLPVGSPFTAHLLLPLQETPEELQLNVIRVTSEDKLKGGEENAWQLWRFQEGKRFRLALEREQDIELSLEPGLYVLKIGAGWKEKGNLSYGFLLEVRANGTVASPEPKIDLSKIKKYPNDGDYLSSEGYSTKILLSGGETGGEYPTILDSKILLLNYSLNYTILKNEDICLPYTANPGDSGILIRGTLKNKYDKDYWIILSASAYDSTENLLGRSLDSGPICGIIARYLKSNETENFELHLKYSTAISKINLSGGISEIMPP